MIFSQDYLNRLIADEEIRLSNRVKAIFNRFSIAITAGVATYQIPENILFITQITWGGELLHNFEYQDFQDGNYYRPATQAIQASVPDYFIMSNQGYNILQFHPTPSDAVALNTGNLYTSENINTGVIITCFRSADPSGTDFRLPSWMLRNVIKYRALHKAYTRQGPGQDLKAASYFLQKAQWIESEFESIYQTIPKAVLRDDAISSGRTRIARPQLPTTGPWSI